ncbi:V-type ATPase subunit [Eubacteriaceae bacterium ES2]|nr:V-type ATPase subunit [Eubacteriaceae bacterium ES2]
MSNSKFSCVNTKVLAMTARKIREDQYQDLIKTKSLSEVFIYLRDHTYYGEFLKNMDPQKLHRTEIEAHLNDLKINQIEKLMHYLSGNEKLFLKTFLVRMEVESLRVLIRGLSRGENLENLKPLMVYSKTHTKLPFERLFKVKDWESFKKLTMGTDYYRVLEIYKNITDDVELIMIEKNLDRYYYDLLKNRLLKIDQKENKELVQVQRRNIDLLNLIWVYRGKKFYGLSREELIAYSLRGGYELNDERLNALIMAKNVSEMKALLENSVYYFLFNHEKTIDLFMERRRERFMYYQYMNLFAKRGNGISLVIAYIRLLDFEVEDITSLIESKRYKMVPEETKKYLIRFFE